MTQEPDNHGTSARPSRHGKSGARFGQREGERSLGQNLAMIGVLGWTIVMPRCSGCSLAAGWNRTFTWGFSPHFHMGFPTCLSAAGLAAKCVLAWKRMHNE